MNLMLNLTTLFASFAAYTSAHVNVADECITPTGNYEQSCHSISISDYMSSDPLLPKACELTAVCATNFAGLPPVENVVYYPVNHELLDVQNNNGTLFYNGRPLTFSTIEQADPQPCNVDFMQGSYQATCVVTSNNRYVSSDKKLSFTKLCEVETSCKTLEGSKASSLIFFDTVRDNIKLENCNGKLKAGLNDQECQDVSHDKIKEIAAKQCSNQIKL